MVKVWYVYHHYSQFRRPGLLVCVYQCNYFHEQLLNNDENYCHSDLMIQCTVTVIVLEIIANYGNIVKTEIIVSKPNSASNEYSSLKDERK